MGFPLLVLGVVAVGVGAALASGGSSRYALSSDCQTNELAHMDAGQLQEWLRTRIAPNLETALAGRGSVRMEPIAGQPVPLWAASQVASAHGGLVMAGMDPAEATRLARIEGRSVYLPAGPGSVEEIAAFLYQQVVPPACAVMTIENWAADMDSSSDDPGPTALVVWPSAAAECIYGALVIATKLELFTRTNDPIYAVTADDVSLAAIACAPASVTPGGGPGGRGFAVGAQERLHMSRLLNAGQMHPAHVLSGAVFR